MGDFDNELRGVLFENNDKQKDEDRDYSGSATIDGREYWLSGWKNRSKSGTPFLSLKFKPKEPASSSKPKAKPDFDDEIDF
jgi:hypothetical protein